MAIDRTFGRDIAVAVIGGLILAALLWLFGLFPSVWAWLITSAKGVWAGLLFSAPMPVWVLLLLFVPSVALVVLAIRLTAEAQEARKAEATAKLAATKAEALAKVEAEAAKAAAKAELKAKMELQAVQLAVSKAKPAVSVSQLDELAIRVLRELVFADGAWCSVGELSESSGKSRLLIEQSVEKLKARDFLVSASGYEGPNYRLSATGRDFAIEQGFVQG